MVFGAAPGHFDGLLEDETTEVGAVHVVVAVDQNSLAARDGLADAPERPIHAFEQQRVVQAVE